MIDIELNIEDKKIQKILEENTKQIEKYNTLEEIETILIKMESSNKNITTHLLDKKEDFVHSLLFYIEKLYKFLLKYKYIDENKIYSSITIVTNDEIKKINKKYRNIDKITDVLSFPAIEKENIQFFIDKNKIEENNKKSNKENEHNIDENELDFFGDIVISLEKIIKQSEEYGHSIIRELSYLIIHSFCHLLGYDHIIKDDEIVMREKEEEILNILNIKR